MRKRPSIKALSGIDTIIQTEETQQPRKEEKKISKKVKRGYELKEETLDRLDDLYKYFRKQGETRPRQEIIDEAVQVLAEKYKL